VAKIDPIPRGADSLATRWGQEGGAAGFRRSAR